MKLLHYAWGAYNDKILYSKLVSLGFTVIGFSDKCADYTRDMEFAGRLMQSINENGVEAIISFDYFPIISMVCDVCRIPYYAWVYDSPHMTLLAKCVKLPCNHIGVFDKRLVEDLKNIGIDTVYYVPLSADVDYFTAQINACRNDYEADIAFLGSMYTDSHYYYKLLKNNDEIWKQIDHIVEKRQFNYNDIGLDERVLEYIYGLMQQAGYVLNDDYFEAPYQIVEDEVINKRVTVLERQCLIEGISKLSCKEDYSFKLYTGSNVDELLAVKECVHSPVGYLNEMPAVFAKSRINLNITLRTIKSGMPLRAIDIMACGGFLLTNRQADFEDIFVPGRDYEIFDSIEECIDKIRYYLKHENKRIEIAQNGQNKVREYLSYEKGLERLFQL